MHNKEIHSHYSDLIYRYLSGNASSSEMEELEAWVLASPENKELFVAAKKTWLLTGLQQGEQQVNVEQLWEQTAQQLFPKGRVVEMKPKRSPVRWLGLAAAVVIVLIASFWFFQNSGTTGALQIAASDEIQTLDLTDGSQITLNQSSSLSFTPPGKEGRRKVKLEGDAFFDVARDEKHPFVIETQELEIEVLGTSFYVDSRKDQSEIQVIVESGRVAVRSQGEEQILTANEKVVFQKQDQKLIKQSNEDPNFLSLKTNTLIFENTKLEEVVFALNRQFRANITIAEQETQACELTATYTNKSLVAVLTLIEASLGIESENRGGEIVLTGKCNN